MTRCISHNKSTLWSTYPYSVLLRTLLPWPRPGWPPEKIPDGDGEEAFQRIKSVQGQWQLLEFLWISTSSLFYSGSEQDQWVCYGLLFGKAMRRLFVWPDIYIYIYSGANRTKDSDWTPWEAMDTLSSTSQLEGRKEICCDARKAHCRTIASLKTKKLLPKDAQR